MLCAAQATLVQRGTLRGLQIRIDSTYGIYSCNLTTEQRWIHV